MFPISLTNSKHYFFCGKKDGFNLTYKFQKNLFCQKSQSFVSLSKNDPNFGIFPGFNIFCLVTYLFIYAAVLNQYFGRAFKTIIVMPRIGVFSACKQVKSKQVSSQFSRESLHFCFCCQV